MNEKDLNKISSLFKSEIKDIIKDKGSTIIEFEDGQILPLYGESQELKIRIPECNFCGSLGEKNEPLFTINGDSYICKNCVLLALETYISNGIVIDIKIDKDFPNVAEQLKQLAKNLQKNNKPPKREANIEIKRK